MKRKISVLLALMMLFSLLFTFTAAATGEQGQVLTFKAEQEIALGDTEDAALTDGADAFTYTNEGSKGYVRFYIEAKGSAEELGAGYLVEIFDTQGNVIGTTNAVADAEGELTHRDYFACADINGTYIVKVSPIDEGSVPTAQYSLKAKETYPHKALFDKFLGFDLSAFEFIQSIQNKFLTAFFVVVTTLGDEGIIFIAIALMFLCTKKYRKIGFAMLVALVVMTICNNVILKDIFARPRPYTLYAIDPEEYALWGGEGARYFFPEFVHRHTSYSFPSGHTSSAFAAAVAILIYNRKIGIPMTVFAAFMGLSRLYVEVHYCTDVIGGVLVGIIYAFIGAAIVKLTYPTVERLIEKITAKLKKKKA